MVRGTFVRVVGRRAEAREAMRPKDREARNMVAVGGPDSRSTGWDYSSWTPFRESRDRNAFVSGSGKLR